MSMVIHSAHNTLSDTCVVQVENIQGMPDTLVSLFAMGAAGLRNGGYMVTGGRVVTYIDDDLRDIPEGSDTSSAFGARVVCTLEEAS